jgi:hypothetical protein
VIRDWLTCRDELFHSPITDHHSPPTTQPVTAPAATQHKSFSLARVRAIAANTLLELVRLKVFYFLLIFALLGIGVSFFTSKLSFQEQLQVLKHAGLGMMSIFTWLLAVLATAMMLPKDIEERTLYTILAKPVPRFEYLLGKLSGILLLIAIALALMVAMFSFVLYAQQQSALAAVAGRLAAGPDLEAARVEIRAASFTANLVPGIALIYVKAAVCAAVTLLLSTFASSSIFTIIVSFMVSLIGHVQPIAREYMTEKGASELTRVFLGLVALLIPDMRAFTLLDDLSVAIPFELFMKTVELGALYVVVYFLVGYLIFAGKEL